MASRVHAARAGWPDRHRHRWRTLPTGWRGIRA